MFRRSSRNPHRKLLSKMCIRDRSYNPEYVLILSGDHIYKMDYEVMLEYHKANNADVTIAAMPVPIEEASRFGILITDDNNRITEFEEKPKNPRSNLASMGIYKMCIRDRLWC